MANRKQAIGREQTNSNAQERKQLCKLSTVDLTVMKTTSKLATSAIMERCIEMLNFE